MKKLLIPAGIFLMSVSACSRKSVPSSSKGRIEQLKRERELSIQGNDNNVAEVHSKHKKNKHKPALSPTNEALNNDVVINRTRDTTLYFDSSYSNYVYQALARAYADTIAMSPEDNDPSLDYATGFVGTTNFNMRKPNFVIIHHTSQKSVDETLRTFTLDRTGVSAHYVIGRDGSIHHMVNDYLRAWQAGIGKWGNVTDMNSCSVGIELDNDGYEPFTDKQINSLLTVLASLKKRFGIPQANFIGHADFAPVRKNDPNVNFPWQRLAAQGYGYWWSDTTNVQVPVDFNSTQALRIIGYDIRDLGRAVIAFRRHFCTVESTDPALSPAEIKVLYCLYTKYMY